MVDASFTPALPPVRAGRVWYPGAEPGGGYVAQRIFSARTERDGVLATLFFQIAHYALRLWPDRDRPGPLVILIPASRTRRRGLRAFVDLFPRCGGFMPAGLPPPPA
jgi:hypothetical protein